MDLALLRKLVRLMTRAELTELEIDDEKEGLKLRLKRGGPEVAHGPPVVVASAGAPVAAPAMAAAPAEASAGDEPAHPPGTEPYPCPMVGTFYRAVSPDADPFVSAGTRVDEDSVLCIIEAMKVMNEIKAELNGEIVEVLVENGEPVEYGQPLFLIRRG
jgi:acetyl-CoA carboxylase biotin carboxyl carrier protein